MHIIELVSTPKNAIPSAGIQVASRSERALAIDERTLDQNDPLFRHDVEMLAMIFEAAGRHGDAQALLKAKGFNIEKINYRFRTAHPESCNQFESNPSANSMIVIRPASTCQLISGSTFVTGGSNR
jgi:hypothetical protein